MEYKVVFVSNYINHHQIPFCNAMYEELNGSFCFIQTEPMEEERVRMGWNAGERLPYLHLYYEEKELCDRLILEAQAVLYGGTDEESYLQPRLALTRTGVKPVMRYSERLYRSGQWKMISPRGLLQKYKDHTRYRNAPVYLLCSGAYVASDFHLVRAYPKKMFRWGYFTQAKEYDTANLFAGKGFEASGEPVPRILWAARFIPCKHPELALKTAAYLKERKVPFHMDIIGGGLLEEEVLKLKRDLDLDDCVTLRGFLTPAEVRGFMEKADIFLMTSDRIEGWGAVINEAMNSGCAVVAGHMIGAVPFLIEPEENGEVYEEGKPQELFEITEELCLHPEECRRLGEAAYQTIAKEWNPKEAARRLLLLMETLGMFQKTGSESYISGAGQGKALLSEERLLQARSLFQTGPCSPAPVIGERKMKRYLLKKRRPRQEKRSPKRYGKK